MPISAPAMSTEAAVFDRLAVTVLAAVAVVAAFTFRDFGLGWDDYTHAQYGNLLYALYASGLSDQRAFSFVNLYEYGGGFDLAATLAAKILPFDLYETRRLCGAVVGIVGLAITWRIARRLGGPLAGFAAVLLLATCPLYLGNMFINAKDAPFAVAMIFLLYALVRAFEQYPKPSAATVALVGCGAGLAIGTRILGGLAALYAAGALLIVIGIEGRTLGLKASLGRAGRFILTLLPGLVIAYAVMALIWPWSVASPLNPLRALIYFSSFFEAPWRELFGGRLILVVDMPATYVFQLLALQLPELLLLLGIVGLIGAFAAIARQDLPANRRATFVLTALAAVLPLAVTLITRPAMYNGIRHFVFVVPPIAVLAGLAFAWLADRAAGAWRYGRAAALACLCLVALPTIEMVRLHPFEYVYFNRFAGGVAGANGRYMLDFWGLAFKQAAEEFRAQLATRGETPPAGRKWRVAVCGPHWPARVLLGPDFDPPTWNPAGVDFAMTLGAFYCVPLNAPVVAEVRREGIVFARVYDLRGRSITNLLTIPPPQ